MADQEIGKVILGVEVQSEDAKKELKQTSKEMDNLGTSASKAEKKASSSFSKISSAITKAAIAAAMIKIGKYAADAFQKFDEGKTIIANATGASGKVLSDFVTIAQNVYADTERGFDEISSALGEINTRFGYTGQQLQTTTKLFADFADATGTDVTNNVKIMSQAINQWGMEASDIPSLMDKLVVAGQQTGVSIDTLTRSLTDNAPTLQAFGYNIDDAVSMLMTFEKSGVNAQEVLMGMKQSFAQSAKAGTDAREDWEKLIKTITDCSDETEANNLAIQVFGTRVAGSLVQNLRSGKLKFDEFTEAIANSQGALEKTDKAGENASDSVEHLKRSCEILAVNLASKLAPALVQVAEGLNDLLFKSKNTADVVKEQGESFKQAASFSELWNKAIKEGLSPQEATAKAMALLNEEISETADFTYNASERQKAFQKAAKSATDAANKETEALKKNTKEAGSNAESAESAAESRKALKEQVDTIISSLEDETSTYDRQISAIEEKARVVESAYNQQLITQEQYNAASKALTEEKAAAEKQAAKESMDSQLQTVSKVLSYTQEAFNSIMDTVNMAYDLELNKAEATYEKEKKALDQKLKDGEISQEEYDEAIAKLDKELAEKKDEVGRKQFEANKATQIATALMNAAQAAIRCFTDLGPIGGAIATAVIAGTTAAQIAIIAQQQYVSGSYAVGSPSITEDQIAEVHKGETILRPADAERFRNFGGMYGIENALSPAMMAGGGMLNTFNLNNQLSAVIEVDGTQLGVAVLKNLDNARQFVF